MQSSRSQTGWPPAPVIYEVDAWSWLHELRRELGSGLTLGDLSVQDWRDVVPAGVEAVWLIGIWQDSDGQDAVGSPYYAYGYQVDQRLGGAEGLAVARRRLAECGVQLILDYVPNPPAPEHLDSPGHSDPDHPDPSASPRARFDAECQVLGRGPDAYFAPWPPQLTLETGHRMPSFVEDQGGLRDKWPAENPL